MNCTRVSWRSFFLLLTCLAVFTALVTIFYMKGPNPSLFSFLTLRSRSRRSEAWNVLTHVAQGFDSYQCGKERFPETLNLSGAFSALASVRYDDISGYVNLSHLYDDGRPMLDRFGGVLCPVDPWGNPVLFFPEVPASSDDGGTQLAGQRPVLRDHLKVAIVASAGPNGKWERGAGDDMFCGVSRELGVISLERSQE